MPDTDSPWQRHGPPWGRLQRRHRLRQHHESPWDKLRRKYRYRQRALFLRLALLFGGMVLVAVAGVVIAGIILGHLLGNGAPRTVLLWIGACGSLLVLPAIGLGIARAVSRNITGPLAGVMAAADAVASGDLSVRVAEDSSGEFGQLAHTFNRMVDELQRIDEQRRNLTADVAHELRTPLHIIRGNLEGILDGIYQPTPEHLQMLLEETQILARLVEDLRTLSLAESGHLPLHKACVQVADLLADLATSFGGQAGAAGIRLVVETDRVSDMVIEADVMRLNQSLANLIVNALRYTPPGGSIVLRAEPLCVSADGGGSRGVRLTVCDTGRGIPPDDLPRVFDRFWRGDPARSHKEGAGGGLGLAIVKQLVELHGGRVGVQSTPGQGTVFTIDLPPGTAADS